uniref:WD_REPEATS_REGION domain-containing protein n=1 Tax=Panagrellus redivivus TaxID=6233 RepID=A0A7E4V4K3_PANRE
MAEHAPAASRVHKSSLDSSNLTKTCFNPDLVPFSIATSQKMYANLFDGEEAFVLPAQRPPTTSAPPEEPFVLEGWEEADHQAPPKPIATPSAFWLRKRALRARIQDAEATRQKAPAPRIGRWLQSLTRLPQQCFEAFCGGFQWVKSMVGGKRKLIAVEGCDAESSTPMKRARLEDANEASAEVEDRQEGHIADEAVNPLIEMPDFDDFGYGAAEDQAATDAILGADDEFNAEPIEPEVQAEEEVMEVDADEVVEVMEVDEVDAAGIGEAIAPVPEAPVVVPPVPANVMPQPAAPRRRYGPRGPRKNPLEVIQRALGKGFEVQLLANGTVKLVGVLPGFDRSSLIYRKAVSGGYIITAPFRSRFTHVSAGSEHAMLLTSKNRLMTLGSNAGGQLGTRRLAVSGGYIITAPFRSRFTHVSAGSEHAMLLTSKNRLMTLGSNAGGQLGTRRLVGLSRVASQTLGSIERGPIGTAKVKFESIMARGTESWAWDKDGLAYYCGTANDGSWRSATFKKVE